MLGTKLREITRALAHHILKNAMALPGRPMSPNDRGHLEMTKAVHCHFLRA